MNFQLSDLRFWAILESLFYIYVNQVESASESSWRVYAMTSLIIIKLVFFMFAQGVRGVVAVVYLLRMQIMWEVVAGGGARRG